MSPASGLPTRHLGAIEGKLEAHLSKKSTKKGCFAKRAAANCKQRYLENKYHVMAVDHALQMGLGLESLRNFQCMKPALPLIASQKRYYVKVDRLPEHAQACSEGRLRRSCLVDTERRAPLGGRVEVRPQHPPCCAGHGEHRLAL